MNIRILKALVLLLLFSNIAFVALAQAENADTFPMQSAESYDVPDEPALDMKKVDDNSLKDSDCQADFDYYVDPFAPGTVFFNDLSLGFTDEWLWDFGDGSFSSFPAGEHTYENPGEYEVCLTISNQQTACNDTYCQIVVIDNVLPCQADFDYFPVINEPNSLQFFDLSIGDIQLWQWDFGDGNISDEQNPIHEFQSPGIYEVCLVVSDTVGECLSVFCELVEVSVINPECEADFTYVADSLSYQKIIFQDASSGAIDEYLWDFGDGFNSVQQNPEHTYTADGFYLVTLLISGEMGNCQDQAYQYVLIVENSLCEANFEYSINPANPLLVEFEDISLGEIDFWYWDFGDGFITVEQNPTHQYFEDGTYTVSLITSNNSNNCLSMQTKEIELSHGNSCEAFFNYYQSPGDSTTIIFEDLSTGDMDMWLWDFGDGSFSDEQNPVHEYESSGIYPVCLFITNSLGFCNDVFCLDVEVFSNDCFADFEFNPYESDPYNIQFTDLSSPGVEIYFWDFGDGTSSDEQNPVHLYENEGDYEVCLAVFDLFRSCTDSICKTITIPLQENCLASYTYTQSPDNPFMVNFVDESSGAIASWNWDFGDGNFSDEPSPSHVYQEEGTYDVCLEVIDISGTCTSIYCDEIVVEAPDFCTADFGFEILPDEILTVSFTDLSEGPLNSWSWDFGDGNMSIEQNPVHIFADTGNYTVSLTVYQTDSLNYCYDSIAQQVQVFVEMPDCAADFVMHPDSGVNKPNLYHFHDMSDEQTDAWLWDFGDGNTSTQKNPVHQYEDGGSYEVSLTVTKYNPWGDDCSDTKTTSMQTPNYFHIGGFVYAGNFPINNPEHTGDTAMVYLYRYHDEYNVVSIDTSTAVEFGYFHTLFLLEDDYMLKVRLSDGSTNAPYYFPTYFGDRKRWQYAPVLPLADSSHYSVDVHLATTPDNEAGVGAINGSVMHHSNADAQVPAGDSEILIFNSANQAVAYAYSEQDGDFIFENLPFDTYTLYAESTGLFTEPVTVTISEASPTAFDVALELYNSDVTSTGDDLVNVLQEVQLFPNPAKDAITVKVEKLYQKAQFTISDLSGRKIISLSRESASGQYTINVASLNKGVYFLHFLSSDQSISGFTKFVKITD